MVRLSWRSGLAPLAVAVALTGCGDPRPLRGDATATPDAVMVTPPFRNPVGLDDATLAPRALAILGANVPAARSTCASCHGVTREQIRYWRDLTAATLAACLTDLAIATPASARRMIGCLRAQPASAAPFDAARLGLVAGAVRLPWFAALFDRADGATAGAALAELARAAAMPRGGEAPWSQDDFDLVMEYVARGLPLLDALLPPEPAPDHCTPHVAADVAPLLADLAATGWQAQNRAALLAMSDCGAAPTPRQCLTSRPRAVDQPYGAGWEVPGNGTLRVLADVGHHTRYWTRSSPDGRFVAHGVSDIAGAYVLDLQRGAMVTVDAPYDPAFFPDDSGFVFQGGAANVCPLAVLTAGPSHVTMTEPGCGDLGTLGLYQTLGRVVGGDLLAIDGPFVSDDGGHAATTAALPAFFGAAATTRLTALRFTGASYLADPPLSVPQPYEGDAVLSPSTRLELTRFADATSRQLGYVLRRVALPTGGATTANAPELARYCVTGGKPAFSYDERFAVFHRYVTADDAVDLGFASAADPGFAPYLARGAANAFLLDLATGAVRRITNLGPGQYAVSPHFRSDGWIYLDVRDPAADREYVIASDAAL